MRDDALKLAAAGTRVFPVGPDKKPRTARGFYDATTDEAIIGAWDWSDCKIAAAIDPGTVVLDVDPRNNGTETMKLLREVHGSFPQTKVARTGGGGFHYYFSVPEDVTIRSGLGPGVDVKRAGKGYVVVPPSSGYRWMSDAEQAEAPEWLLEELVVEEKTAVEGQAADAKYMAQIGEKGTKYGLGALDRELGQLAGAKEGGRNDKLNAAAYLLATLCAGGELDEDHAKDKLMEVALKIGLEPAESTATIKSGFRAGLEEPRQAPPKELKEPEPAFQPRQESSGDAEAEGRFWTDWTVDEPPPPFYLNPIIPKNAYILVFGPTEASKSMVFMALGSEASLNGHNVSFYSLENPAHIDRGRLQKWRPDPSRFRITHQPVDLNDAAQLTALIQREQEWDNGESTDILILDTYSHAFGSRSEDGNAKAIEFARRIRYLMQEVECSVIVIDHTGFGDQTEPRDASAKRQQVDQAIQMQKLGEWQPGAPARFTMTNRKSARFGNPFAFSGEIQDTENHRAFRLAWIDGGHGEHGGFPTWEG